MSEITLLTNDLENNYKVYFDNYIVENKDNFLEDVKIAYGRFDMSFPNLSPTWTYRYYNIFSLTFGSLHFYNLFNQLKTIIRDHSGTDEPLWFQSWMNFHTTENLLDWHEHGDATFHGYVSIDPKKTKTIFRDYEIENKTGKIYIGQSFKEHKVVLLENFDKHRITLGFDVYNYENFLKTSKDSTYDVNISFFPI